MTFTAKNFAETSKEAPTQLVRAAPSGQRLELRRMRMIG